MNLNALPVKGETVVDTDGDGLSDAEEELADIRDYDRALPKVRRELAAGQSVSLREYQARRARKRA